ncbi:hypothetical protein AQUCO_04200051v1 [Aquilegia coerulea]|uniref:Arginosuccinate synthase-like N-terminal domain-containing protein n=1 Tax=Aquilegia coerulea TaxID=218851 RepID=A0A2G5CP24_AQUCA|nr:hypothetical protein AQUCO_04200051v1 [Aquilegia coerulea]
MAQFQAISPCFSANPIFNAAKRTEISLNGNRVCCSNKTPLYQELGAKLNGLNESRTITMQSNCDRVVRAQVATGSETDVSGSTKTGGLRGKLNKVVLAYSGGLDTSIVVPWLRENYGCEVVCFTADVGQGITELDGLEEKAKASGASQLVVKDLTEEFVKDFIFPCLRAGAIYERKYLLGTSMARPVIAKLSQNFSLFLVGNHDLKVEPKTSFSRFECSAIRAMNSAFKHIYTSAMVDVAKAVGADAVAHGCTGKGNDQVSIPSAVKEAGIGIGMDPYQ